LYKPRILIVDDNPNLAEALTVSLNREGYESILAGDGVQGLDAARGNDPDLVILDLMLPGIDGFEVCRALRQESKVPILVLSAKGEEVDKVLAMELGADDYMTKPFSMKELLARIRASVRRAALNSPRERHESVPTRVLEVGQLMLDPGRHIFKKSDVAIYLGPKEFDLVELFMANPERLFSREQLLERVWGYKYAGDSRTVDVHVVSIRKKIEDDPADPKYLVSVRGVGYRLENPFSDGVRHSIERSPSERTA
jgi:DNA-binding response OmpR family regulator